MHTGVIHDLDLDHDGKRMSWLSLPYSIDRSPYYQIKIPVCVVRNGAGPSLLLMAGNHGDEYEGELSLARLIRRIDPAQIRGRITIVPMANLPAVMASRRRSPFDDGNLNRAFPGDPLGTPTQRIAHFLEHELFPRHDAVFDIHSGGTSMAHLVCALIERNPDTSRHDAALALMHRLGLPYGFVADNGPQAPTSMGAARRSGAIGISGEFGGGASTTPATMAATAAAIDGAMQALGIVDRPILSRPQMPAPMQLLSLIRPSQSLYATRRAWFEPAISLGDTVEKGSVAGWLHDLDELDRPEQELRFLEAGIVLSIRLHTHCEAGDCLVQVAEPIG
jgi:predicted deacylase